MAKKTSGQNPVDEAYLRSLMAGVPIEPPLSSAPSTGGGNGENRETALSEEKGKADDIVNETVSGISGSDDAVRIVFGYGKTVTENDSHGTG